MLCAGKVGLRARDEADVAVLHAELYEDIATPRAGRFSAVAADPGRLGRVAVCGRRAPQ